MPLYPGFLLLQAKNRANHPLFDQDLSGMSMQPAAAPLQRQPPGVLQFLINLFARFNQMSTQPNK
jgi:hypothetical protein